jgi:serine/threonine protein phosphatase PrpC
LEVSRVPGSLGSGQSICVSHAIVPDAGEDSFVFQTNAQGGYLCVADGCGGLGSKRYASMGGRTGAFLAANLVTQEVERHLASLFPLPGTKEAGESLCLRLAALLSQRLRAFEEEHSGERRVRIVGRMQRALPTTLCLLLMENTAQGLDCLFLWAGDSRGYLLDFGGLHQLTADHTSLRVDAMESLYRDVPLSNMVSGQDGFFISGRRVRRSGPCVGIVATDGAYACLQNPMEMEWLLLWTLHGALDLESWRRKLHNQLVKMASDDCTLQLVVYGYQSFEELREGMEERRLLLQKLYITPVRRRKADLTFARDRWRAYMPQYDWTERTAQGEPDWRV